MLTIKGRAKINLTLDILGKRPDGYHEVAMVMQQVELADIIKLREEAKGTGITLVSDVPGLPSVERNIAYKAAKVMLDELKIEQGVYIQLEKCIPIAAGLAGGSADAAAVIVGINEWFKLGLNMEQLCDIGSRIGSDVPFCIRGGTMLATGRGEILKQLPQLPECYVILAKPNFDVSTAWAYQNYKSEKVTKHPKNEEIIACLEKQDLTGVGSLLCNVLESVVKETSDDIAMLKQLMLHHGAMASLMSGSGPTVFGLTPDEDRAEYIADKLRELTSVKVFVTKTVYQD